MSIEHLSEEYKELIQQVNAQLRGLSLDDPLTLTERPEINSVNFASITPLVSRVISLVKDLRELPLEVLPEFQLRQIKDLLDNVFNSFKQLEQFSLSKIDSDPHLQGQAPTRIRDQYMNEARSNAEAFWRICHPVFVYLKLKSPDFQQRLERADELVKSAEQSISTEIQTAKEKTAEIESVLQVAREAAGKVGVQAHATKFQTIAAKHTKLGYVWLIAVLLLTGAIVGTSVYFMSHQLPSGPLNDAATIQKIASKLVFISTLYFAVIVAARNYRAHRHLTVINEHRQTALDTFETFVKAANKDEATKNAVLLEATRCIFASTTTGYLGAEEENPNNRIIEIFKMVGGKS